MKGENRPSVAVCGLGGLGSNIAVALARTDLVRLHLIDFDRVDISNINRQQYRVSQIGKYKTKALKEILQDIIPGCEVIIDTVKITRDNLKDLLQYDDMICEAFDDAEAKAMLANGVMEEFSDKYLVAASGMAGLGSANSIRTRKITDRFYICGDGTSDVKEEGRLYASRAMVCAAHQAHMIVRLVSGEMEP